MAARARRSGTTGRARAAGLEQLWSPWRMAYIARAPRTRSCLFCALARSRADRRDLVVARAGEALLVLNRYPYNPAHVMVAVRRHAAQFRDLSASERADLAAMTALAERALEAAYAPHGLNYGVNVGRVAGAGVPGHLHLHLVPRWDGDTNFLTVLGGTRTIPEDLPTTRARLAAAFALAS